ncbi:hypothetical protein GL286_21255 [Paracoccus aestuariivivens]|uniref:Uncharacterized protein n=1 Tax=Paracoccus aestuariivivens TaxID=1820333 RepID=A0A6L6JI33_9RHOB|nr:hypothetical protein [Paracoccus aestuariivivens]
MRDALEGHWPSLLPNRTQDSMSLRAVPHVHAVARTMMQQADDIGSRELASATDNTTVAEKLHRILDNFEILLAIELICAAQAVNVSAQTVSDPQRNRNPCSCQARRVALFRTRYTRLWPIASGSGRNHLLQPYALPEYSCAVFRQSGIAYQGFGPDKGECMNAHPTFRYDLRVEPDRVELPRHW